MMTGWMLHAIVVSAAIAAAAMLVERVLRLWRREARAVWGVAMALSLAVPALSLARRCSTR